MGLCVLLCRFHKIFFDSPKIFHAVKRTNRGQTSAFSGQISRCPGTQNGCRRVSQRRPGAALFRHQRQGDLRRVIRRKADQHGVGFLLHAACVPHGILLTEYKDGQFYCADPSEFAGTGIIPIEQAWGTRIENSNAYWYVSSEVADPTQAPVVPEASAASIHPDTTTLLTGPKADEEETACLIGQALGVHA